jgi:hypothetical protein
MPRKRGYVPELVVTWRPDQSAVRGARQGGTTARAILAPTVEFNPCKGRVNGFRLEERAMKGSVVPTAGVADLKTRRRNVRRHPTPPFNFHPGARTTRVIVFHFALAVFVKRPQAVAQIGAAMDWVSVDWQCSTLPTGHHGCHGCHPGHMPDHVRLGTVCVTSRSVEFAAGGADLIPGRRWLLTTAKRLYSHCSSRFSWIL